MRENEPFLKIKKEIMELRKLPKELLLEIVIKQNSPDYLTIEESVIYRQKLKEKINRELISEFKKFFPFKDVIYSGMRKIRINTIESSTIVIEFYNKTNFYNKMRYASIFIEENGTHILRHYNCDDMKEIYMLDEYINVNRSKAYEFFIQLMNKAGKDPLRLKLI